MKYRKKPVVIEAMQWTGSNQHEIADFMDHSPAFELTNTGHRVVISTREGDMRAEVGDWIIKEPFATEDRRFYPCKPDIFTATYEVAEDWHRGDAAAMQWYRDHGLDPEELREVRHAGPGPNDAVAVILERDDQGHMQLADCGCCVKTHEEPFTVTRPLPASATTPPSATFHGLPIEGAQ